MSELHVYCDESGNKPTQDGDEIFIAGAVTFGGNGGRGEVPVPPGRHARHSPRSEAVRWLAKVKAYPVAKMFKPYPGFGEDLARKLNIVRWMLSEEIRQNKPRSYPLPPEKLQTENLIWIFSMLLLVSEPLIRLALEMKSPLRYLRVFVDSHSLSDDLLGLYEHHMKQQLIGTAIEALIKPIRPVSPEGMERGRKAAELISGAQVTMEWKHEDGLADKGLLSLADAVAHYVWKERRNVDPVPGFQEELQAAGRYEIGVDDITRTLVQLDVVGWERRMGVEVPEWLIFGTGEA